MHAHIRFNNKSNTTQLAQLVNRATVYHTYSRVREITCTMKPVSCMIDQMVSHCTLHGNLVKHWYMAFHLSRYHRHSILRSRECLWKYVCRCHRESCILGNLAPPPCISIRLNPDPNPNPNLKQQNVWRDAKFPGMPDSLEHRQYFSHVRCYAYIYP